MAELAIRLRETLWKCREASCRIRWLEGLLDGPVSNPPTIKYINNQLALPPAIGGDSSCSDSAAVQAQAQAAVGSVIDLSNTDEEMQSPSPFATIGASHSRSDLFTETSNTGTVGAFGADNSGITCGAPGGAPGGAPRPPPLLPRVTFSMDSMLAAAGAVSALSSSSASGKYSSSSSSSTKVSTNSASNNNSAAAASVAAITTARSNDCPDVVLELQEIGRSKEVTRLKQQEANLKSTADLLKVEIDTLTNDLAALGCLSSGSNRGSVDSGLDWMLSRSTGLTGSTSTRLSSLGIARSMGPSAARMRARLLTNLKMQWAISGHMFNPAFCCVFDRTCRYLITGADDFLVKIWDAETGILVHTCKGHSAYVSYVAVSPDNALFASACTQGTVRVWRLSDGVCVQVLKHQTDITWMKFDAATGALATGSEDSQCIVWDLSKLLPRTAGAVPLLDVQWQERRTAAAESAAAAAAMTRTGGSSGCPRISRELAQLKATSSRHRSPSAAAPAASAAGESKRKFRSETIRNVDQGGDDVGGDTIDRYYSSDSEQEEPGNEFYAMQMDVEKDEEDPLPSHSSSSSSSSPAIAARTGQSAPTPAPVTATTFSPSSNFNVELPPLPPPSAVSLGDMGGRSVGSRGGTAGAPNPQGQHEQLPPLPDQAQTQTQQNQQNQNRQTSRGAARNAAGQGRSQSRVQERLPINATMEQVAQHASERSATYAPVSPWETRGGMFSWSGRDADDPAAGEGMFILPHFWDKFLEEPGAVLEGSGGGGGGSSSSARFIDLTCGAPSMQPDVLDRQKVNCLDIHPLGVVLATGCQDGVARIWRFGDADSPMLNNLNDDLFSQRNSSTETSSTAGRAATAVAASSIDAADDCYWAEASSAAASSTSASASTTLRPRKSNAQKEKEATVKKFLCGRAQRDDKARVERVASHLLLRLTGHVSSITDIHFNCVGDRLLTGSSSDCSVRIWSFSSSFECSKSVILDLTDSDQSSTRPQPRSRRRNQGSAAPLKSQLHNVCWTADGSHVVTVQSIVEATATAAANANAASGQGTRLKVFDSITGDLLRVIWCVSTTTCTLLACHPTHSSIVMTSGEDGYINVWNVDTAECLSSTLVTHPVIAENAHGEFDLAEAGGEERPVRIVEVSFSDDGTRVAATDLYGRVLLLGLDDPERYTERGQGRVLPEQYFSSDYARIIHDEDGFAIDEGTQAPVHEAPVGSLCNVHLVAYRHQPDRRNGPPSDRGSRNELLTGSR